jgi:hypothetical protein
MEKLMNYNWNVYKVFKNGKRAKAPLTNFEATEDAYIQHFENEVKKNFTGNLKGGNFKLIRSDLPQERAAEIVDEREEKISKEKNRVLGRLVRDARISTKRALSTALICYPETNWSWQWAAVEAGTSRFVHGLSPQFTTSIEAEDWIQEMISLNQ